MSNVPDGLPRFEMSRNGRGGNILYRDGDRTLQIPFGTTYDPALDMLIAPVNLSRWIRPAGEPVPLSKQLEILARLRDWLSNQHIKSDIERPQSKSAGLRCVWASCLNPQWKA